ncbi:hypothetical protein Ddc_18343 [Ditylenchus destructor]|nr:hypothetical protein Ddc_18343 [Ditylenchus destructor]
MLVPKPYVRFRKVYIFRLLGESTLKFLRDAKESFVGSAIHYFTTSILDNKDMRNQMHYLFQNVFHKPSYISFHGPCLEPKLEALTDGLVNCSKIKLQLRQSDDCNEDTIRMVLNWFSNDKSMVQNPQRDTEKKHLVLQSFPRRFILNLVQQIKDVS